MKAGRPSLVDVASRKLAVRAKSRHADPELLDLARDLLEALRVSYPATPVDCLISEIREMFGIDGNLLIEVEPFEARVAQFKAEVAE